MRPLPVLLALVLALSGGPAGAQDPPNCTPARAGMVACLGEKLRVVAEQETRQIIKAYGEARERC